MLVEEKSAVEKGDEKPDVKRNLKKHEKNVEGVKKVLKKFNKKDTTEVFNQLRGHHDGYVLGLVDEFCIGKNE